MQSKMTKREKRQAEKKARKKKGEHYLLGIPVVAATAAAVQVPVNVPVQLPLKPLLYRVPS